MAVSAKPWIGHLHQLAHHPDPPGSGNITERRQKKWEPEDGENCDDMLSSVHDTSIVLMTSQRLCTAYVHRVPAQSLYTIKAAKIPSWQTRAHKALPLVEEVLVLGSCCKGENNSYFHSIPSGRFIMFQRMAQHSYTCV